MKGSIEILKKKISFFVMVIVAVIFVLFIPTGTVLGESIDTSNNPLYEPKVLLNYLFWTKDKKLENDVQELQKDLNLSKQQMELLKSIGLKEREYTRTLQKQTESLSVSEYNATAITTFQERNKAIQDVLGTQYKDFENWIVSWWEKEKVYRQYWLNNKNKTFADVDRIVGIFATQYAPNTTGAYEVALPDKYLKFANFGWCGDIPDAIESNYSNPVYRINVYNPNTNKSVRNVAVNEVGPWNTNDNYWDSSNGNNPRRFGINLPLGTPASSAAYYNNWNNGKDQGGRTVLNPAGIDLTPKVATDLGLGAYQNAWVDIRYELLP